MEDYSPATSEGEETPIKSRRLLRGNFLDTWLDRRDNDEEDDDSVDKPKKSKFERWRNKLRNIFKLGGLVSLELVPKESTTRELPKVEPKTVSPEEQIETPTATAETTQTTPIEGGLLTVSHEDQQPDYDFENIALTEDNSQLEELVPEIPTELEEFKIDYIDSKQPEVIEYRASVEREQEQAASISPNVEPASRTNLAEPVSEVIRRRQTERLEKKVKKLKRDTKTIKREQADVKEQQQDFAKKLEEREKAQARFEKVTVPKMEKARQELKKRLETAPEGPTTPLVEVRQEKPEVKAVIAESTKQPLVIKSEYKPETKQTVRTEQLTEPEAISVPSFEVVPGPTIVSEKLYDRRREVKDLASYQAATNSLAFSQIGRTPVPSVPPPLVGPMLPSPSTTVSNKPSNIKTALNNDMYKQAAKNGFFGGIILLILLLLYILLMRLWPNIVKLNQLKGYKCLN